MNHFQALYERHQGMLPIILPPLNGAWENFGWVVSTNIAAPTELGKTRIRTNPRIWCLTHLVVVRLLRSATDEEASEPFTHYKHRGTNILILASNRAT
jgi:hypothetical protein